ncbi:hypothetical protein AHF37_09675 [Paragonimus kellicotti]|nr:hypothetical protein AHF37_09675 [Paragonimus kellicotti]
MEIRRRNVGGLHSPDRGPTELLQALDVFPKLPDDCKKATTGGGAITLVTAILCILLIFSEISNYVKSKYEYGYEVDRDFDTKIQINIDLTVATKCEYTSLDLLDVTGSSMSSEGKVRYRKTMFRLPEKNRLQFERRRLLANVLRSNHHVLPDMLWKRDHLLQSGSLFGTTSAGSDDGLVPTGRLEKYDACHIVGTLFVRKVAGNMHLIPGKAITGPGGTHLHISPFLDLTGECVCSGRFATAHSVRF